jgi:hypothetical protein
MSRRLDKAQRLFEEGFLDDAAALLHRESHQVRARGSDDRVAEIDDLVGQMRAHLEGDELRAFDRLLAGGEPDERYNATATAATLSIEQDLRESPRHQRRLGAMTSRARYALAAVACVIVTWPASLIGQALDVRPLRFWGVLTTFVGIGWLLPGVFIGIATTDWARDRGHRHPKGVGIAVGVGVGVALIIGWTSMMVGLGLEDV